MAAEDQKERDERDRLERERLAKIAEDKKIADRVEAERVKDLEDKKRFVAEAKAEDPGSVEARMENAKSASLTQGRLNFTERRKREESVEALAKKKVEDEVAADMKAREIAQTVPEYDNRVPGVFRPRPGDEQVEASERYRAESDREARAKEAKDKAAQFAQDNSSKVLADQKERDRVRREKEKKSGLL